MTGFKVPRNDNVELAFDGDLLADVTSRQDGQSRWTEVRIYRTDSGRFVTEMVGRTTNPGEYDRINVAYWEHAADVRRGLLRPRSGQPGVYYLTDLAIEAIEIAATKVPDMKHALEERI